MQLDISIVELLSSKLCHDLVSPVSAVNNGVELMEDGGDVAGEALKLIASSADQAARRLRLFRMAYGRAGSEASLTVPDMRSVAESYMSGGKISLAWPVDQPGSIAVGRKGVLKTLLNALMLAEEALIYGGLIRIEALQDGGKHGCRVLATGRGAALTPAHLSALALETPLDELAPKTVQAYVTGSFAKHYGVKITPLPPENDTLTLVFEAVADDVVGV
jgi:histidine phosphotransferase ChpT